MVIAERWPTWVCCSGVMNIFCVKVFLFADVGATEWFAAFQAAYPRSEFFSNVTEAFVLQQLSGSPPFDLILVQVDQRRTIDLSGFASVPTLWCGAFHRSGIIPAGGVNQLTLTHAECGGVLDGQWTFWCNSVGVLNNTKASPLGNRRLRHIVNAAAPGRWRACDPPDDDDCCFPTTWRITASSNVLDWNGLLPVATPLRRVRVRSVFVPTQWTCRGLTSKELCCAFDVPLAFQAVLGAVPPGNRDTLPFLGSVPTKICKAIWDRFHFSPGGQSKFGPADSTTQLLEVEPADSNSELSIVSRVGRADLMEMKGDPPEEARQNPEVVSDDKATEAIESGDANPEVGNFDKATKSDDAAVPVHLWDDKIWALGLHSEERVQHFIQKWSAKRADDAHRSRERLQQIGRGQTTTNPWIEDRSEAREPLGVIREAVCAKWKLLVLRSFMSYMRTTYGRTWWDCPEARADIEAGRDCIERMADADFWAWRRGSRCFYWRWPESIRLAIRDGFPLWTMGSLPTNRRPQRGEKDPQTLKQMREKIEKVRLLGYIRPGFVTSLTNCFSVPKGERDIRMVYDATKSKLNQALWVPSFALPTVDSLTRQIEESTWMADLDLGDMFLNFMLDAKLRASCGIDIRPFFEEEVRPGETLWERWERCLMGLKSSPYVCVKAMLLATEIINGDRRDPENAYRWDKLVLNLPGTARYDPRQPWLKRIRSDSGKMAGATVTYVDDLRSLGESAKECWRVVHQTGSRIGYLGIQNAPRKTRPPSQTPGAWAGTVAEATPAGVGVKCSVEKWNKGKKLLTGLREELSGGQDLEHKPLEQMRGFFVHIQGTYPNMTPYLKGMHLTLDGWRPGRDKEMWKVKSMPEGYWDARSEVWVSLEIGQLKPPKRVRPAPRLSDDVDCLLKLMAPEMPPTRLLRSSKISVAVYGFADASGAGFGSSIQTPEGLSYRYGLWGRDADNTSSNYKELRNLVEAVEEGVASGELLGTELFIFTDNSTAEGAFYKGNTSSRLLFDLVLRLRVLDMRAALILHIIHIAGTRMISQGVDALSRGDQTEGVMAGRNMLEFVPLHLDAFQRSSEVGQWISSWWPQDGRVTSLSIEEWFEKGHGIEGGKRNAEGLWVPKESTERWMLWVPPPAIADVAVEELMVSRHKRSYINHVFVCPRVMTQKWRKKLHKVADIVIEIPAGVRSFWPRSMHEPLIVGLTLRFISRPPWQLRRSNRILELEGQLRGVWKGEEGVERGLLRELCALPDVLEAL